MDTLYLSKTGDRMHYIANNWINRVFKQFLLPNLVHTSWFTKSSLSGKDKNFPELLQLLNM